MLCLFKVDKLDACISKSSHIYMLGRCICFWLLIIESHADCLFDAYKDFHPMTSYQQKATITPVYCIAEMLAGENFAW